MKIKATIPVRKVIYGYIEIEVDPNKRENWGTAHSLVIKSIERNTLEEDYNPFQGKEEKIELYAELQKHYYKEFYKNLEKLEKEKENA